MRRSPVAGLLAAVTLGAVLSLAACSKDATGAADHALPLGRYAVTVAWDTRPGLQGRSYTGTLDVTASDAFAIDGSFTFDGVTSDLTYGGWDETAQAYSAHTRTPSGQTAILDIGPNRPDGTIWCRGTLMVTIGEFVSAACSVRRAP